MCIHESVLLRVRNKQFLFHITVMGPRSSNFCHFLKLVFLMDCTMPSDSNSYGYPAAHIDNQLLISSFHDFIALSGILIYSLQTDLDLHSNDLTHT